MNKNNNKSEVDVLVTLEEERRPNIFYKHLDRFFGTINDIFAKLKFFLFDSDGEDWFGRGLITTAFSLIFIGSLSLHNCSEQYFRVESQKLKACKEVGMSYVNHTDKTLTCLNKNGSIVSIEINKIEFKTKVTK